MRGLSLRHCPEPAPLLAVTPGRPQAQSLSRACGRRADGGGLGLPVCLPCPAPLGSPLTDEQEAEPVVKNYML